MRMFRMLVAGVLVLALTGCVLTKIITVPMRVVGAVISIIPVAGNKADAAIDSVADTIDDFPI